MFLYSIDTCTNGAKEMMANTIQDLGRGKAELALYQESLYFFNVRKFLKSPWWIRKVPFIKSLPLSLSFKHSVIKWELHKKLYLKSRNGCFLRRTHVWLFDLWSTKLMLFSWSSVFTWKRQVMSCGYWTFTWKWNEPAFLRKITVFVVTDKIWAFKPKSEFWKDCFCHCDAWEPLNN